MARFVREEVALDDDDATTKKKGFLALYQVHQAIVPSIFSKIQNVRTAKSASDIVEKIYQGDNKVQKTKLMLNRKFELLKIEEIEMVESYFSRITDLISEMEANGKTVPNKVIVEKVLNTC